MIPPQDLDVKTVNPVRCSIRRQLLYVALGTAALLLIPLIAMQFTEEVDWTPFDFFAMGVLLFGTGLTYVLLTRTSGQTSYRLAVGVAVGAGLILTWMNLAVGLIGNENNPANQLYGGVFIVALIGSALARLRPNGMARALLATALAQFLVPIIALIIWRPSLDNVSGIAGIFILNGFFAALFFVSALLFRRAGESNSK
jgi:hypothetical protein